MIELHWIRRQLYHWGLRNRAQGIGYPNMATTERARIGRGGGVSELVLPPDLEEIDLAVRRLEREDRRVIAECYTHGGSHSDHMVRLCMPETTYYRKKKIVELRVYSLVTSGSEFRTIAIS